VKKKQIDAPEAKIDASFNASLQGAITEEQHV